MITSLVNQTDFKNKITSSKLMLVDFYADWCEPCKWLDEILNEISTELTDEVSILKVDTELFPQLQDEWNVKSVPVLMLFKNGKVVWRINGFLTTGELLKIIRSFI